MAKVTIDIANKFLNKVAREELKSLRAKNLRLQRRVDRLKEYILNNQDLVRQAWALIKVTGPVADLMNEYKRD